MVLGLHFRTAFVKTSSAVAIAVIKHLFSDYAAIVTMSWSYFVSWCCFLMHDVFRSNMVLILLNEELNMINDVLDFFQLLALNYTMFV